jgi:hypothetical protein
MRPTTLLFQPPALWSFFRKRSDRKRFKWTFSPRSTLLPTIKLAARLTAEVRTSLRTLAPTSTKR